MLKYADLIPGAYYLNYQVDHLGVPHRDGCLQIMYITSAPICAHGFANQLDITWNEFHVLAWQPLAIPNHCWAHQCRNACKKADEDIPHLIRIPDDVAMMITHGLVPPHLLNKQQMHIHAYKMIGGGSGPINYIPVGPAPSQAGQLNTTIAQSHAVTGNKTIKLPDIDADKPSDPTKCSKCGGPTKEIDLFVGKSRYCPKCEP